ncbi:hypothetical protein FNH22_30350 [Fulvivirga sp. M361]|uniref:hypothetical protein n=1 Tax=Fulvivirga sp. M361 TaxID=2594266 RepID=UPI00117A024D|nr:hypothetical protein [Fulvivirga sp. M361]TRX47201.1 hypothetical protein FNH22_30350 [Fulvivirga sp. M361]
MNSKEVKRENGLQHAWPTIKELRLRQKLSSIVNYRPSIVAIGNWSKQVSQDGIDGLHLQS